MAQIINGIDYEGVGIYLISGVNNRFIYVGQSKNVHQRIEQHRAAFISGSQSKKIASLSDSDIFVATLLEKYNEPHTDVFLCDREYFYAKKFDAFGEYGLNTAKVPDSEAYSGHPNSSCMEGHLNILISNIRRYEERLQNYQDNPTPYNEKLIRCVERDISHYCLRIHNDLNYGGGSDDNLG